jgi:ATP-dependent Zn protease
MNNKNHPLIFWTIVIVSFLLISKGFAPSKPVKEIQYSEFVQLVKEDKINEVQFGRNNIITGTIDGDKKLNFETSGPSGDNIVNY